METVRCLGRRTCSPFVTNDRDINTIHYVSAGTGDIYQFDRDTRQHNVIASTGGEPLGAAMDHSNRLHVADQSHAAILRIEENGPGILVKSYEDRVFLGPSAITFLEDGTMLFTDSGPFGETTIDKPLGSVFSVHISPSGEKTLSPILFEALAHPCGIAVYKDAVYVTEMMKNRIVRMIRAPGNVYHTSVFYQFSGGLGPSCVACGSDGSLYIGHHDFPQKNAFGKISVLDKAGTLLRVISVPGIEITGLCLSHNERELIVTEASMNAMHCVKLQEASA